MLSYVITGVSRGIGWEFLTQLSSDPKNTVVGIVRNKPATDQRVASELKERNNITILEADLTDYVALKKAAADSAKITGGKLDYLVANAGYVSLWDAYDGMDVLGEKPEELTAEFHKLMDINVLAIIHLYSLFMPQILRGSVKKVVVISSGHADLDFTNEYTVNLAALYAISKAAVNMVTGKFNAQYQKDGVLFLSICPGMVDVGHFKDATPKQLEGFGTMLEKFKKYAPDFKGPDTPEESVKAVLSVVEKCSLENRDGGAFLSHFGTRQWI